MSDALLFAAVGFRDWQIWYAAPLIAAISIVYSGTRHERLPDILLQSYHTAIWLVGFMFMLYLVLWVLSRQL